MDGLKQFMTVLGIGFALAVVKELWGADLLWVWMSGFGATLLVLKILKRRWAIREDMVWTLSILWPMLIPFGYFMYRTQESLYRERVVRQVMDS